MRHAKGDVVIYMDADLQDPPELVPTLVETWRADPEVEVVYTTRRQRQRTLGFVEAQRER